MKKIISLCLALLGSSFVIASDSMEEILQSDSLSQVLEKVSDEDGKFSDDGLANVQYFVEAFAEKARADALQPLFSNRSGPIADFPLMKALTRYDDAGLVRLLLRCGALPDKDGKILQAAARLDAKESNSDKCYVDSVNEASLLNKLHPLLLEAGSGRNAESIAKRINNLTSDVSAEKVVSALSSHLDEVGRVYQRKMLVHDLVVQSWNNSAVTTNSEDPDDNGENAEVTTLKFYTEQKSADQSRKDLLKGAAGGFALATIIAAVIYSNMSE